MIRSELDVLLDRVDDSALQADLRKQIDRLHAKRSFGLVFEHHIPERVRLPQHPVRVGSQVVRRDHADSPTWEVVVITDGLATLRPLRGPDGASLARSEHAAGDPVRMPVDSLVVMSDFGEPVLPGFRHLGSIDRGGDKPYHTVIKGENHHALEALRFTHAGKIDCIYIDPPYNSGARDWKYNNDYVDDADAYRHSKWLAFMERRLKLAKELLNPDDSVLIVTIDEKELLRLGLLLQQIFPGLRTQMITTVTNTKGVARRREFARVEEHLLLVFCGTAGPSTTSDNMLTPPSQDGDAAETVWLSVLRRGSAARRVDRPQMFYPILVSDATSQIIEVGDPLLVGQDRLTFVAPPGAVAVWPIRTDDSEGRWQLGADTLRGASIAGTARLGRRNEKSGQWALNYLSSGTLDRISRGDLLVAGKDARGALVVESKSDADRDRVARTVWNRSSHDASTYGTSLLRALIPRRAFPFPKSLYAVEDTRRFFVKDRPDAVVLDFFAGSGTTAQAVARLNRQDGGRRQAILVTNNEVSASETQELRAKGLRPGDAEWEALGIFEHITRPRPSGGHHRPDAGRRTGQGRLQVHG